MTNNKTKKTSLIFLTSILSTIITSVGSLFVTKKILECLGSDYNGVNATAVQIVTILGLIEGGFTLASQVALYKPVSMGDLPTINRLISFTAKKMRTVGILTLAIGIFISTIYSFFVKSELSYPIILCIMLISIVTTSINVGMISKYRLMFQVTQTEYIYGYINIAVNVVLYFSVYFALDYTKNVIIIRLIYFLSELLRGYLIYFAAHKFFQNVVYNADTANTKIEGTQDVFVSKITGLIYNSAPVLFISTFISTSSASVYTAYLSVTNILLTLLTNIANAPTHGLGQLISESNNASNSEHLSSVYREYEFLIALINSVLCSIMFTMMTPFIALYTRGVSDINYVNTFFSVIMVLTVAIQILHMPCGVCMSVAGRFKAIKYIQIFATLVLMISMVIGVSIRELEGLLVGKLITAVVLSICEIVYTYTKIIHSRLTIFLKIFVSTYVPATIVCILEHVVISYLFNIDSWGKWVILGFAITLINVVILIGTNCVTNHAMVKKTYLRAKNILYKR